MLWCSRCNRESSAGSDADQSGESVEPNGTDTVCRDCGHTLILTDQLRKNVLEEDWGLVEDLRQARAVLDGYQLAKSEGIARVHETANRPLVHELVIESNDSEPVPTEPVPAEPITPPIAESTVALGSWARSTGIPFLFASFGLVGGFFATGTAENAPGVFPWLMMVWIAFGVLLTIRVRQQENDPGRREAIVG